MPDGFASGVSPMGAGFPSCLFELSKMSKECSQALSTRCDPDPTLLERQSGFYARFAQHTFVVVRWIRSLS